MTRTAVGNHRSAALLLRVWLEDGAETFRGRLTSIDTAPGRQGSEEANVAVVSSPGDAAEAVRAWLAEFLDGAPESIDSHE